MVQPSPLLAEDVLPTNEILTWLGVLLAIVLCGAIVLVWLKRVTASADQHQSTGAFPLEEIRRLHATGELTDEEFARARDRIIRQVKGEPAPEPAQSDQPAASENDDDDAQDMPDTDRNDG